MSKFADRSRRLAAVRRPVLGLAVLAICLGTSAATLAAATVQGAGAPPPEVDASKPVAQKPNLPVGSRMRCWQHGRLLFEEYVQGPPDGSNRFRMATPGGKSPVYLLETHDGLCLIQSASAD